MTQLLRHPFIVGEDPMTIEFGRSVSEAPSRSSSGRHSLTHMKQVDEQDAIAHRVLSTPYMSSTSLPRSIEEEDENKTTETSAIGLKLSLLKVSSQPKKTSRQSLFEPSPTPSKPKLARSMTLPHESVGCFVLIV